MLRIIVSGEELFDEKNEEFITVGDFTLDLEHSLVSLSKWESKFQEPFLAADSKTSEKLISYVEFMILNPVYPKQFWKRLTRDNLQEIISYIESTQSATTFGEMPHRKGRGEIITSELIYYWMVAFNIPFECEHWHLNRLFSLIRICNIKNSKSKKMSRSEMAERNRSLNAQRRAKYNTTG